MKTDKANSEQSTLNLGGIDLIENIDKYGENLNLNVNAYIQFIKKELQKENISQFPETQQLKGFINQFKGNTKIFFDLKGKPIRVESVDKNTLIIVQLHLGMVKRESSRKGLQVTTYAITSTYYGMEKDGEKFNTTKYMQCEQRNQDKPQMNEIDEGSFLKQMSFLWSFFHIMKHNRSADTLEFNVVDLDANEKQLVQCIDVQGYLIDIDKIQYVPDHICKQYKDKAQKRKSQLQNELISQLDQPQIQKQIDFDQITCTQSIQNTTTTFLSRFKQQLSNKEIGRLQNKEIIIDGYKDIQISIKNSKSIEEEVYLRIFQQFLLLSIGKSNDKLFQSHIHYVLQLLQNKCRFQIQQMEILYDFINQLMIDYKQCDLESMCITIKNNKYISNFNMFQDQI